ncbi:dodecin family protein [Acidimicrobiaceae bacterium]|nr:dodecin family protein [Acidimicrobiaceae bacterium]
MSRPLAQSGPVADSNETGNAMDSVYNVIELIGTSDESWEGAAAAAVAEASKTLRDLRVAEVTEQDLLIEDGKIVLYRTKIRLSFKHESGE